jgi:hypothetical protein
MSPHRPNASKSQTQETSRWLPPLPILFNEEAHRYQWQPTGQWLNHSVTQVCKGTKDAWAMKRIMETKHIWEPRGKAVHLALETFLTTGEPGEYPEEYSEWVEPLLEHSVWNTYEAVACEYRLADLERNIAGSFDCLLRRKDDHQQLVLVDLKTQGKADASPYDVSPQLGGYLGMLSLHWPQLYVQKAGVLWSRPGSTTLQKVDVDEAVIEWQGARDAFLMLNQPEF